MTWRSAGPVWRFALGMICLAGLPAGAAAQTNGGWDFVPAPATVTGGSVCATARDDVNLVDDAVLGRLSAELACVDGDAWRGGEAALRADRRFSTGYGDIGLEAGVTGSLRRPSEGDGEVAGYGAYARLRGETEAVPVTYSLGYTRRADRHADQAVTGREAVGGELIWALPGAYRLTSRAEQFYEGPAIAYTHGGRSANIGLHGPLAALAAGTLNAGIETYARQRWIAGDDVVQEEAGGVRLTAGGPIAERLSAKIASHVERVRRAGAEAPSWDSAVHGSLGYRFVTGEWRWRLQPGINAFARSGASGHAGMGVRFDAELARGAHSVGLTEEVRREIRYGPETPFTTATTTFDYDYSLGTSRLSLRGSHAGTYELDDAQESTWSVGASWGIPLGPAE